MVNHSVTARDGWLVSLSNAKETVRGVDWVKSRKHPFMSKMPSFKMWFDLLFVCNLRAGGVYGTVEWFTYLQ